MDASENNGYSRFSLSSYNAVLETALSSGFEFRGFEDPCPSGGKPLIIRIDVDYSPEWAVELARINRSLGIGGNFFLQPDSPNYNLSSRESAKAVMDINGLDQAVGLHFWEPVWEGERRTVERVLSSFHLVKRQFPFIRPVVCWHNPIREVLDRPDILKETGLINAYSPPYFAEGCYFSDSNCRNYPRDFLRILAGKADGPLVFLFHPLNWVVGGEGIEGILRDAFRQKVEQLHDGFCHNSIWASGLGSGVLKKLRGRL